MPSGDERFVRAGRLDEIRAAGCRVVQAGGHTVALFAHGDEIYAVDNRCPHMGFPLDKGTVNEGILTCHWHHARFDLHSGGTFDQFADDVRIFPVEIRDGDVWIDVNQQGDPRRHQKERLQVGLERDIPLVVGKAVQFLLAGDGDAVEPFQVGLAFGTQYRRRGWGQGLTILTCLMKLLPALDPDERPRALYQGLSAVARESFGQPPRFPIRPLPGNDRDVSTLKRWFRQFVEVRDAEGAERCVVSAIRAGASDREMADMLFAAITDHRYVDVGHPADFTNKAFEALDIAGWGYAEPVLASLVTGYTAGNRMEEANAWRHPVDLIALLRQAFDRLPGAVENGSAHRAGNGKDWDGDDDLVPILLDDDPQAIADALLDALATGCTPETLAGVVSYAAALRIARFHTSNEFPDWDTALHTFTFANAIEQGLRRAPSVELLRGVFDAAMSVYLDRFLNVPAARIPQPGRAADDPDELLAELLALLDRQQQVNQAADRVGQYLYRQGEPNRLLALLGKLLLREDRDFHTIQAVEAAFNQYRRRRGTTSGAHVLIAAVRYLAAHSPTVRSQGQTYEIARRLHRGDLLYE